MFERLFKSYKIQLDPLGYEQARKAYFDELYKYDIENLNSSARLKDVNLQENQEKYSDFSTNLLNFVNKIPTEVECLGFLLVEGEPLGLIFLYAVNVFTSTWNC